MNIDITSLKNHLSLPTELSKSEFTYEHPEELVAQKPADKRTSSRLLVREKDGQLNDSQFIELPEILSNSKPLIVRNSSRVMQARLFGETDSGAKVEVFLLEPLQELDFNSLSWKALGKPLKKLKPGKLVRFSDNLSCRVAKILPSNDGMSFLEVTFNLKSGTLQKELDAIGSVPLPPYIKREITDSRNDSDQKRYQTVYSEERGSVAAPTAGLHFNHDIEERLKSKGCDFANCILHVGAGTFLPVKSDNINQHNMHSEKYCFSKETVESIIDAHSHDRPILCIGTTSFRALESFVLLCNGDYKRMRELSGKFHSTDLFLKPANRQTKITPSLTNMLMTNFHQPESTLIMMIATLTGYEGMKKLYGHAVEKKYRLFSYGDSCLLKF
jgi:S-adenosylmethionine:tRNA ribosyltransferase-isomerase